VLTCSHSERALASISTASTSHPISGSPAADGGDEYTDTTAGGAAEFRGRIDGSATLPRLVERAVNEQLDAASVVWCD